MSGADWNSAASPQAAELAPAQSAAPRVREDDLIGAERQGLGGQWNRQPSDRAR